MNRDERRKAFFESSDRLDLLVSRIAAGRHWSAATRPPVYFSRGFVQRLMAHAIRADLVTTPYELWLIREFHEDDLPHIKEEQWITRTVDEHPDFAWHVPEFFLAACRHDAAEGTTHAFEMIEAIGKMCDVIAMSDHTENTREHLLKNAVIETLYNALKTAREGTPQLTSTNVFDVRSYPCLGGNACLYPIYAFIN